MNPFEMIAVIVLVMGIVGIVRSRHARRFDRGLDQEPDDSVETQRLREEVQALKDRVAVLERIITDQSSSLEREIEQLRDR